MSDINHLPNKARDRRRSSSSTVMVTPRVEIGGVTVPKPGDEQAKLDCRQSFIKTTKMVDLMSPKCPKMVLPAGSVIHFPENGILQSVDGSCPLRLCGCELIPVAGGRLCIIGLGATFSIPLALATDQNVATDSHRPKVFEIPAGSVLDFDADYLTPTAPKFPAPQQDNRVGAITSSFMLDTTTRVGRSLKVGEDGLVLGPAGLRLPHHLSLARPLMLAGKMELLGDTAVLGTFSLPDKSFEVLDGAGKKQMTTYDASTRILPKGAILPCTTILPAQTVLLQGTLVPGGSVLPAGTRLADCSLPAGTILMPGTRVGGSMGLPDGVLQYE
ncbi:hypothetical protein Micbo1qcDRAFT_210259 [Microdochium bolleyi]|uniref:Uncharacterized protein n=1 Tax=Microdochium bolleyi TaxID=196109 RepID=A0A136IJH1_9PEZI|nr:hypothetical protein Micbo1qcDRAFT_210259 [Microdochium bolleyi]